VLASDIKLQPLPVFASFWSYPHESPMQRIIQQAIQITQSP
jgi:hypothetical protein